MAASGNKPVITRFAPSPTGYLHIGGGRTALFSYLYAKHHGGQFRLRIEDTDADRHDEEAAKAIINGMEWLGCKHDGEIVRQSQQKARHQEVANKLVAENKAYKCYCSKEELEAMRAEADKNKVPFRYPGKCRDVAADFTPPAGVEPVVRIKTEVEGSTKWTDKVQGTIEFPNKDIDDFIILRSDGSPTYLLAVVVDDHDMEITDVIRGSDHISNTPRQLQIYKQCGWEPPFFGHIPLIHGMDGQKLSKRHGATGVEQYEALGYLPEAMRNYLARLSWSHGNDEIFTTQQAIEWFDLKDCSKSASCFDFDKLKDLNAHYIKECDNDRLFNLAKKFYPELAPFEAQLKQAVDMLKPRAKTIVEYREAAEWIVAQRPLTLEAAAAKNTINDKAKPVLADVKEALTGYTGAWDAASLEPVINQFAEAKGLKLGQVAQPLRGALTGTTASPGIYEVMWVLGKEGVLGRIEDVINGLNKVKDPPAKAEAPPKEEKKDKKDKGGKAAPAAADQPEFTKLDIRVGVLTKTWHHPESDKLWCEEIDIGEAEPRQVASGLRAHYEADKFCAGRKVVVVVNLKPAKMAGFESAGMVLCAATEDHSKVELLEVPDDAKVGERVFIEGLSGEPLQPNQVAKKSVLKYVLPDLKTDGGCVACWQGKQILTSAGPVKAPTMSESPVG
mmetsp:Transcript_56861/g.133299  ORF Transcript_56861/g.133299 Transcript_56861/m.133299 type:complete len:673 (+) Transcript_56861:97-2115(+)